ncbi:hypothetical protein XENOCAPTIV_016586 [Xenoophorus captivus]|uniref:Uncharacterized protein n=1 Tax=Xenoophorus captivus TaxID=1517983 RepID=A0ABV0S7D3_9TELE
MSPERLLSCLPGVALLHVKGTFYFLKATFKDAEASREEGEEVMHCRTLRKGCIPAFLLLLSHVQSRELTVSSTGSCLIHTCTQSKIKKEAHRFVSIPPRSNMLSRVGLQSQRQYMFLSP